MVSYCPLGIVGVISAAVAIDDGALGGDVLSRGDCCWDSWDSGGGLEGSAGAGSGFGDGAVVVVGCLSSWYALVENHLLPILKFIPALTSVLRYKTIEFTTLFPTLRAFLQ